MDSGRFFFIKFWNFKGVSQQQPQKSQLWQGNRGNNIANTIPSNTNNAFNRTTTTTNAQQPQRLWEGWQQQQQQQNSWPTQFTTAGNNYGGAGQSPSLWHLPLQHQQQQVN